MTLTLAERSGLIAPSATLAMASEAKRLKADALNSRGGRYVVALQTARMFENISSAVMTPEQYIAFIRQSWSLIGLSPGGPVSASSSKEAKR